MGFLELSLFACRMVMGFASLYPSYELLRATSLIGLHFIDPIKTATFTSGCTDYAVIIGKLEDDIC